MGSACVRLSSNVYYLSQHYLILGVGDERKVFGAEKSSNGFSNGWGTLSSRSENRWVQEAPLLLKIDSVGQVGVWLEMQRVANRY